MIFTTAQLKVRKLHVSDLNPFHEMQSDPMVMRYTGSAPTNWEENKKNLSELIALYEKEDNDFWIWAIERNADKQFVGTCAIVKHEPHSSQPKHDITDEIGYRFLQKYWGKGYGTEITEGLLNYAFNILNKPALLAEVDERNTASVKLLDRFMHLKGKFYNERDQSNDFFYSITQVEYPKNNMKTDVLANTPPFYHTYIKLVADQPLVELLENGGVKCYVDVFDQLVALGDKVYAANKWTVKQIIQHCIDTERIFVNRALRFVRKDATELPGYDENYFADHARVSHRSVADLLEEYQIVRQSTILFFKQLNNEELHRKGTANGGELMVLAIGYILVGHPLHHFNVLKERYFGL